MNSYHDFALYASDGLAPVGRFVRHATSGKHPLPRMGSKSVTNCFLTFSDHVVSLMSVTLPPVNVYP